MPKPINYVVKGTNTIDIKSVFVVTSIQEDVFQKTYNLSEATSVLARSLMMDNHRCDDLMLQARDKILTELKTYWATHTTAKKVPDYLAEIICKHLEVNKVVPVSGEMNK